MDPGIGVDVVRGEQPVAMANRRVPHRKRGGVGPLHGLEACIPQPAHRRSFVVHAIVEFAHSGKRRSRARRQISAESPQRLGFVEDPRELAARGGRNAVQHHRAPELEPRSHARHLLRCARAQFLDEQCFDVLGANAAGGEFVAIPRLGQIRLAPQADRGILDRLFKWQVLEGVQRVVVNEDADRPLRREQGCKPIDQARQGIAR
jgi:hypothetical protein